MRVNRWPELVDKLQKKTASGDVVWTPLRVSDGFTATLVEVEIVVMGPVGRDPSTIMLEQKGLKWEYRGDCVAFLLHEIRRAHSIRAGDAINVILDRLEKL